MKNIFENAYFGKAYKTRDGRKALFMEHNLYDEYVLVVQDHKGYYCEIIKGETGRYFEEDPTDIVSEWQEEINEEELAKQYAENSLFGSKTKKQIAYCAYLKGYRKAKEI